MKLAVSPSTIRALSAGDLGEVVAIDAVIEGRSRSRYIESRLAAAKRDPSHHAQLAAVDGEGLAGYILARVLEGEFGRRERALRLELLGVRPDVRRHGVGRQLLDAMVAWGKRHDVAELRTAADHDDERMLGWFTANGFTRAPTRILEMAIDEGSYSPERDDALSPEPAGGAGSEIDYGDRAANDFERIGRGHADVTSMSAGDLAEIGRIDRRITGRDRATHLAALHAEAMDDAGVRVSLAARVDDAIVGYLMARADHGDFGRTAPVAVIDTLGVDPGYQHRGVGQAMLAQLLANLGALRVERVETAIDASNIELLGFFMGFGFAPAKRLSLVRPLAG